MKKLHLLSVIFITVTVLFSQITMAQWTLQNNPLGSGEEAMVGKIQFVSATEGWISAGSNGSLLHTTNSGNAWNIVTPFPGEVTSSMSDPGINMSWTSPMNGCVLKTYGSDFENGNGMVLYSTTNGGGAWSKKEFPKTITTVNYYTSDLQGTWQMHELVAGNSSNSNKSSVWIHGTVILNAAGSGNVTNIVANGKPQADMTGMSMNISSNGIVNAGASADMHGFMSADKSLVIMTTTEMEGSGYGLIVLQKQITGTVYTLADLQGNWQMHGLSSGDSTGHYAGWVYAALTANATGNFAGTFTGPESSSGNIDLTSAISSSGIITGLVPDAHGFMSADKKSFYLTMTGENNDRNIVVFQKQNNGIVYTQKDLWGRWQMHAITADNMNDYESWSDWMHGQLKTDSTGNTQFYNFVVNGNTVSGQNGSITISSTGILSGFGASDSHGFLSSDKSLGLITTTDGSGGYTLGVLQKDRTISDDFGLQVQFVNSTTGWASNFNMLYSKFQIYKTTDGGTNWNPVNTTAGGIYHFVDANNGWMIGAAANEIGPGYLNKIYHTTDGGTTWTLQYYGAGLICNAIHFSDLQHGWVVGENGLILKTIDGGANWVTVSNTGFGGDNVKSKCVYFLDANTGWIGYGYDNTEGVGTRFILATKDGGNTWKTQSTPVTNSIFSIAFWDANNGWFTSDYGQIAHFSQKSITISAGGLSSALTPDEKNTISSLEINGTVDARDFKTMRDSLPMLSSVDLSGTTVVAYTGTLGTYSTASTAYPANTIPQRSFYYTATKTGKTTLNSFIFPAGVTSIDLYAFRGTGLTSINIPSTVTSIGYGNFMMCSNLSSVIIPSSVTFIDKWAFGYCTSLTGINIPSSVTSIGDVAFGNSGLTNIEIPNGVTTIGSWAFQACESLTNISIPASVSKIGYCAFIFNSSLKAFEVSNSNPLFSSMDGVLFDKTQKKLIAFPGDKNYSYTIPTGVTVIDTAAFEGCWKVWEIFIPNTVHTISPEAFYWCNGLNSITIPASVTKIGAYAFYNCTNLYGGIHANSVSPIDLSLSDSVFNYIDKSNCTLYVPTGSKALYEAAYQWKDFLNIVEENPATLKYSVTVPSGTKSCYIAGDMTGWGITEMTKIDELHYAVTLVSNFYNTYKYVSGPAWAFVEKDINGNDISNRNYSISDTVKRWSHIYDSTLMTKKTYSVTVPVGTNSCYIAGDMNNWNFTAMSKIDPRHYNITLASYPDYGYKYSSGPEWNYVEVDLNGNNLPGNRVYAALDTVARWNAVCPPLPKSVAIVQNFWDPEIDSLQSYLHSLGLAYRVFDKNQITYDSVRTFDLLIWDDLSYQSGGISDYTVDIFSQFRNAGKPIYYIGDDLAYSIINLSTNWAEVWTGLIHLSGINNYSQTYSVYPTGVAHPVMKGPYGQVGSFNYDLDIDYASRTNTGEVVLATTADSDVLLAYDGSTARSVTQNCMVMQAGSEESITERKKLFKNAVWWLMKGTGFDSYWTGITSDEWENPANWSTGVVPTETTNVIVNATTPNSPVIRSQSVCQSLYLANGVNLKVNTGYTLNILGH